MKKIDPTVAKETRIVALGTAICCIIMNIIFFLLARFTNICVYDYTVVTGSLLGGGAAVLNFLLMGITVQNSVMLDADAAKTKIQKSYMLRTALLVAVMAAGVILKYFHWLPVLISVFFPRIVIVFRSIKIKKDAPENNKEGEG